MTNRKQLKEKYARTAVEFYLLKCWRCPGKTSLHAPRYVINQLHPPRLVQASSHCSSVRPSVRQSARQSSIFPAPPGTAAAASPPTPRRTGRWRSVWSIFGGACNLLNAVLPNDRQTDRQRRMPTTTACVLPPSETLELSKNPYSPISQSIKLICHKFSTKYSNS